LIELQQVADRNPGATDLERQSDRDLEDDIEIDVTARRAAADSDARIGEADRTVRDPDFRS
jgi:hypothetical protein